MSSNPFRTDEQNEYLLAILLKLCESPAEAMEKLREAKELLKPVKKAHEPVSPAGICRPRL